MRVCVLLVVLCALGASATQTDQTQKTMANVVYTQPHLDYNELSEVIHPYAWSSQMPTPHYDDKFSPYELSDKALEQFLEVQTHVKADSAAARSLVEVASTSEQHARKGIFGAIGRGLKRGAKAIGRGLKRGAIAVGRGIKALFGRRSAPYANPKGFSTVMRHSLVNNPATYRIRPLKPVPSDFLKNPRQKYATGSFPGSQHYRRGTYGLRRRRIPYYSKKEGFGSANPFRRANNFFNSPADAMLPKTDKRSPYYAATHAGAFDIDSTVPAGGLPYGGFSSFRHHRFRAARNQAATEGAAFSGSISSPSMPGANSQFLSDGSPNPFRAEDVVKHTHPGAAPLPPSLGEPSPFVSGDNTFRDFYGGGGAGGESAGSAAEF